MLLDALQRQQKDAAELREQLAARDAQLERLRSGGTDVKVRSPLKMDPAELLRGASRAATQSGSDPVIQSLWTDDDAADDPRAAPMAGSRSGRAPLGALDSNAPGGITIAAAQKRKPQAVRIGRGCTCGGCSMDEMVLQTAHRSPSTWSCPRRSSSLPNVVMSSPWRFVMALVCALFCATYMLACTRAVCRMATV